MSVTQYGERIGKTAKLSVACSGFIFSPNRKKLLLTRRKDNGEWCVPGGRLEAGESLAEACIRELREETGLETCAVRVVGVFSNPDAISTYPDGNRWQMVEVDLEMEIVSGEPTLSNETTEFGWFSEEDLWRDDIMSIELPRIAWALRRAVPYFK